LQPVTLLRGSICAIHKFLCSLRLL
jgi:hypothetical protein